MTAWLGWLSLGYSAEPGQWYAGLNFAVHALMYSYYTAAAALPKPSFARWCRPLAPFITTIQILQMAAYAVVNAAAVHYTQPPTHLGVAAAFAEGADFAGVCVVAQGYFFFQEALPPPGSALHRHEGYTHEGRCHIHPVNLYVRSRLNFPCCCDE